MSTGSMFALFGAMLLLAFVPGVSVITVVARSAACGFSHGVSVAAGIVVGDIAYILAAVHGLAFLADLMGNRFELVTTLGGAYLCWLGLALIRSRPEAAGVPAETRASPLASFTAGLLITLADYKAILFYLGFLPAFLDLSVLSIADTVMLLVIAAAAVGGPKIAYAYLGAGAGAMLQSRSVQRAVNSAAALVLIAVGVFLIVR